MGNFIVNCYVFSGNTCSFNFLSGNCLSGASCFVMQGLYCSLQFRIFPCRTAELQYAVQSSQAGFCITIFRIMEYVWHILSPDRGPSPVGIALNEAAHLWDLKQDEPGHGRLVRFSALCRTDAGCLSARGEGLCCNCLKTSRPHRIRGGEDKLPCV